MSWMQSESQSRINLIQSQQIKKHGETFEQFPIKKMNSLIRLRKQTNKQAKSTEAIKRREISHSSASQKNKNEINFKCVELIQKNMSFYTIMIAKCVVWMYIWSVLLTHNHTSSHVCLHILKRWEYETLFPVKFTTSSISFMMLEGSYKMSWLWAHWHDF